MSVTGERVHLLLSAGRGPQECAWAVAQLTRRLETEAAKRGVRTCRTETVPADRTGTYRSVLLRISGVGAADLAAAWTGTLCWQAPSPYRASTGRKNWYVIAQPREVDAPRAVFSEADVDIVGCRTGGPGGQHRNKASTAVRATHRPTGIVVVVDTERQFTLNRRRALRLISQRIGRDNASSERLVSAARWRVHDELVRGDPVRVERPDGPPGAAPPARR